MTTLRPLGPLLWVLAAVALTCAVWTKPGPGSWADGSRLATIESLVERGTLSIDGSTFEWQGDKVRFGGRYYSHQPPMQALLGAVVYAPLHHGLGWRIDEPRTYRALTWGTVGLPVLCGLLALAGLLRAGGLGRGWTAATVAAAYFATPLMPYSLVLNQHGAAAGLVLIGFWAVQRRAFAGAGAALALAATCDLTAAFPAPALALAVGLGGGWRGVLRYGLTAAPILALHFSINVAIAGDLLPFGMHAEAFRYAMSPFMLMSLTGVGSSDAPGALAAYVFEASFGSSGLFSHHPLLLVAVAACAAALLSRAPRRFAPGLGIAAALSSIGIAAYYLTSSRNLGGSSFGIRWFTVFVPLLFLGPAALLARGAERLGRPWRPGWIAGALLASLALWSVLAAGLGAVNPWTKFHYLWELSPRGRVALADDPRPATRLDHLAAEWQRIHVLRPIERREYDRTFGQMLDQLRRAYLRPESELGVQGRAARAQAGLDLLQPVVDLMDAEQVPMNSRVQGHFWLGKLWLATGERARGVRELELAAQLDPTWAAPAKALEQLAKERAAGSAARE